MATMTIMRGVPGSGKSTWAREHRSGAVIVSADDYFYDEEDVYRFDLGEIAHAHAQCFRRAMRAVSDGVDLVIDNTATQVWEMAPYVLLAQASGYDIEVVRVEVDPDVAAERNIHGVPAEAVRAMADRMEPLLPFWGAERLERG